MPLSREEEKKLIIRCKKGDSDAMGFLYDAFKEELLRSAILILRNEDEAQDIVSETFVLFFKSIGKFDTKYPIRPWLHKILHNQSTTLFNKKSRSNDFDEEIKISFETFEPNQEELVFNNEEIKYLQKAMREIREEEKWILENYYYEDLSIKEISSLLSVPEGTVKSRLFHARENLAKKIKELFENRSQENKEHV